MKNISRRNLSIQTQPPELIHFATFSLKLSKYVAFKNRIRSPSLVKSRNSRAADTSGGIGGDGGERELADSDGSAVIGGEASGSDAAASGADGKEVEVVVAGGVGAVLGIGANGEGAAAGRGEGD